MSSLSHLCHLGTLEATPKALSQNLAAFCSMEMPPSQNRTEAGLGPLSHIPLYPKAQPKAKRAQRRSMTIAELFS